jgi:two-component system, chemotaxis family, protein-glutamate methylesterase/glutaminase
MIKVLLTDDSLLTRAILRDIFRATADICVVGEAENGQEAVAQTGQLRPDLIVMDLMMPIMDGLVAIEEIMAQFPTPILVLSATIDEKEVNHAFAAIKKGALDVMEKPGRGLDGSNGFAARICEKVRMLARIKVIRRRRASREKEEPRLSFAGGDRNILAIGASTGGPKAVMSIIRTLTADFPAAVFVVQHIASGFAKGFAQWLGRESAIRVRLAEEGLAFRTGEVLVAPNDSHMVIDGGRIRLLQEMPVNCCRPSIDVLFDSLAAEHGARTVGVLLTGMGRDGAQGMRRIKEQGGVTIVQDEESCAVFGMPKAAISLAAVDKVLPLVRIPEAIVQLFTR